MKYLIWAILWLPIFIIGLAFSFFSPIVAMFVVREPYLTTVKRLGRKSTLLNRDRLVWWLTWFDTFDNATDEYWYGVYDKQSTKTQEDYDNSKVFRWYCRMRWLLRNSAYTFNLKFFSLAKDSRLAWQYKARKPINLFGYTINDIDIGWKSHDGFARLSYAGRFFGPREKV